MPGMSVTPALMLAIMSRSGATILRMSMRERFMSKSSPSWASVGCLEDVVLQGVDLVVEVGEDGEEAVHQGADDEIHDDELGRGDLR